MGLLSRLTARPAPAPASAGSELLWRRAPFYHVPGGDEWAMTLRRGGSPVLLPAFVLDFVGSCTRFRTLDAHLAAHAAQHGWGSLEIAGLQHWLPQILEAELLVSTAALHARCRAAAAPSTAPARITALGFTTGGDRWPLLGRALASFGENVRAHQRTVDFLISDGSPAACDRARLQERLRQTARERNLRILYAGEEEKRRFAARLIAQTGCAPDIVEFALFDPLETGFTCGANRNALLLHTAGEMLCSIDDDVHCRLSAPLEPGPALALFSAADPYARWLFPDPDSVRETAPAIECDFVAAHENLLGRGVDEILPGSAAAIDFSQVRDQLLERFEEGAPQIRATFCGHAGDPGIPTSAYYLYYDGANLARLTASEAHYRSVFASRSVLTLTRSPAIGDASVSPGMAMGLDHRELLPPFFPVLHAEDFIFGATLWQCCPRSVLGHLPFAVAHEPTPGKPILLPSQLGGEPRGVVFEFAHLVRRLILSHFPAPEANTAARLISLGRALGEIGSLLPADFRHFIASEILRHESERLAYLERQLRENPDAPEFWRSDVHSLLEHAHTALRHKDFDIPRDLHSSRGPEAVRHLMQQLIQRFADLLQAWPALVATARELRATGEPLFREVEES